LELLLAESGEDYRRVRLTIWGAVLGAALGVWIYNRFTKRSFGYMADMLAPGIILAQAVGRVG
jgi:phosphatidylglycerol:prolipoprotein diacylglycerol transferase